MYTNQLFGTLPLKLAYFLYDLFSYDSSQIQIDFIYVQFVQTELVITMEGTTGDKVCKK